MKITRFALTAVLWIGLLAATRVAADTQHYVALNGQTPVPPYTSWDTAATNIQDAVNVACTNAGDIVLVTNGTYYSSGQTNIGVYYAMIIVTNGITLQSVNGPAVTIIDGNFPAYTNRVLFITHSNAFVAGFTITNGNAANDQTAGSVNRGGGVHIVGGGTLSNCVITGNAADRGAGGTAYKCGGVFINANGTLIDSLVCGNTSTNPSSAGGVYLYGEGSGKARILNCAISNNFNTNQAYAVYVNSAVGFLSNCTIIGNQGAGLFLNGTADTCRVIGNNNPAAVNNQVGGVSIGGVMRNSWILNNTSALNMGGGYLNGVGAILSNCVVSGNVSGSGGCGGIYVNMNCSVVNCTITSNSTTGKGGGVYYAGRNSVMRNCLISSNRCGAGSYGGGVYFAVYASSTGLMENCTIVNNYAGSQGGGIYLANAASGTGTVINTIIYSNTCTTGPNWYTNTAKASFIFCCTTPTNNLPGANNISNAPVFVDFAARNYRLAADSPGINAGTNQSWMINSSDLDGKDRIRYGIVDMGAYECEFIPKGIVTYTH